MAEFKIKGAYKRQYQREYFDALLGANTARNEGKEVILDPLSTPMQVALSMSGGKQYSYVKEQAFPDELIEAAMAAFAKHGKKVLVVIADTDIMPKNEALSAVINHDECRNFTGEKVNENHHASLCLGNLVANHPKYAGVLQRLYEIGAIEFAFDKIMRDGFGTTAEIVKGMKAQTPREGYGMTVYGNSWGSPRPLNGQDKAINDLSVIQEGVCHVFAAGNAGQATDGPEINKVIYPAAYPYAIAVGAIDEEKDWATFSNPGPPIDLCAGGVQTLSIDKWGNTSLWNGTSSSTPHVAGLAAILYLLDPEKYGTHDAIKAGLQSACIDLEKMPAVKGRDTYTGYGLPWLLNLLDDATPPPPEPEPKNNVRDFTITDLELSRKDFYQLIRTGKISDVAIKGKVVIEDH